MYRFRCETKFLHSIICSEVVLMVLVIGHSVSYVVVVVVIIIIIIIVVIVDCQSSVIVVVDHH